MPDSSLGSRGGTPTDWVEDLDVRPGQRDVRSRIDTLENRIRENPAEWRLRLGAAQAYVTDGDFGAAAVHLRACHDLVTDPPLAAGIFFNLGVCLQNLNRWREAVAAFEQCLFLLPNLFWGHYQLGVCHMKLGDWARAVDDLRRAVALNDAEPEGFRALRDALQGAGRMQEAGEAHFRLLELRVDPDAPSPGRTAH